MAPPSRRPLAAAALLVAAAALLMALVDADRPRAAPRQLDFPRFPRQAERQRIEARRTLPPAAPAQAAAGDGPEAPPPPPRDPFLLALPADAAKPLLVLEANALRHSRLGELFVDCLVRESRQDPFEEVRRDAGIDPLKDIDRIALAGDGVVLYGFFGGARLEESGRGGRAVRYGDEGRIFSERAGAPAPGAGARSPVVGAWRDQLLAFGERAFVEATIDRLEGRAPPSEPLLREYLTYGEAYGVLPGDGLRSLFHGELTELGERLAQVASRIELHADAMRDVTVVARVSGEDEAALEDLGTAFGAALSVGRVQARLRGDEEISQLLEHARIVRGGHGFSLELALPVNVLERWFEGCGGPPAATRSE